MLCFVLIFLFTKPALVLFACSGPLIFGKTGGRERLLGATSYLESELLQLELCSNRIMVIPVTKPPVLDASSSTRIGSSINAEVNNHDETEVLAVAERLPVPEHQGENLVEMDFFFSGGDFLELQDLDNPASSSSSENSSAVTISSDECFDSMAFLQDLDDQILEQNDASKKLNVSASNNLDEVVIVPATLGSLVRVEGSNSGSDEFFKTAGSATISASGSRDLNKKVAKHAKGDQRGEGPSSPSRKPSTSSESHTAAAGGRKRAAFGGMKKLGKKFMPF